MLSDYLSELSDTALVDLAGGLQPGVWGSSGSITIGDQQVFAKRVPLTDLEVARPLFIARIGEAWSRLAQVD